MAKDIVSQAWHSLEYRNMCRAIARKKAQEDPSDPFVYARLLASFRSGVLEPQDVPHKGVDYAQD